VDRSFQCLITFMGEKTFSPSSPKAVSPSSFSQAHPGSPKTTPVLSVWPSPDLLPPPRMPLQRKSTVCGLNSRRPLSRQGSGSPLFQSSTRLVPRGSCPSRPSSAGRSANASLSVRKICPAYFFDRNRTSKKLRQLPKPRLCCGSQNQLTNRLT
jgi:hypothetical protein